MWTINKRLFIWLFVAFIIATVVGTITHEGGHYLVARCLGYKARINYMATWYSDPEYEKFLGISAGDHFPELEKYNQVLKIHENNDLRILLGGPLETMMTGTLGLIFLFLFRRSFENATKLSLLQWFLIFISLFWLRQTANAVVWLGKYFLTGHLMRKGDEIRIAYYLHLPNWAPILVTAALGAIVLALIIFKFIPVKQRITFIASGLIGGITGYIVWLELLGKYIIP